jgi:hypothetical protein
VWDVTSPLMSVELPEGEAALTSFRCCCCATAVLLLLLLRLQVVCVGRHQHVDVC